MCLPIPPQRHIKLDRALSVLLGSPTNVLGFKKPSSLVDPGHSLGSLLPPPAAGVSVIVAHFSSPVKVWKGVVFGSALKILLTFSGFLSKNAVSWNVFFIGFGKFQKTGCKLDENDVIYYKCYNAKKCTC